MKFILILNICSAVYLNCLPPITDNFVFNSWQECANAGYLRSIEEINKIEYDSVQFQPLTANIKDDYTGWEGHFIPREIIKIPGALLLAGREIEAKRFLDYVWPEDLPKKDLYWKEFKEQLARSKYWEG